MRLESRYFFFGFRTVFLISSLIFSFVWLVMGFDSTVDTIFNDDPAIRGVGFHWSTFNALTFLFYFSVVNMQVGGFKNLKQVWFELKTDLKIIFSLKWGYHREIQSKRYKATDGITSFLCASTLSLFALFVFEYPYVFMLNWFHFDSLLFPVYTYNCEGCLINSTHLRNISGLVSIIPFVILAKSSGFGKYRFDKYFIVLIFITVLILVGWIYYPSTHQVKDYYYFQKNPEEIYYSNVTLLYDFEVAGWTWPKQKLFPQTIYIVINATKENPYHFKEDLDGWWQDDPPVHLLNVVTKYMVFLSVGYLFMVKIKE